MPFTFPRSVALIEAILLPLFLKIPPATNPELDQDKTREMHSMWSERLGVSYVKLTVSGSALATQDLTH